MIIHWILAHLPATILFASTVGVGIPALDTAPPVVDIDSTESSESEGVSEDEEISDSEPVEGQESSGETKVPVKTETKVDWKVIPKEVKSHLEQISKTDPKLGNLLQNAIYTSQTFLREVPGGLKEIRALKASIEEVGGIDEIKNLKGIHKALVDEQETLDNQARSGNPQVLDNLIEIAGEGFGKLMPSAMSKWESSDPQGYQHEMSKLMVSAMKDGGIVSDLNMAFSMLKLNTADSIKEGIACLTRVANWINGIGKVAEKAPERPKVDPKIAEEQRNIDSQKAQLFNQEFSTEFGSWRNRQISSEVQKIAGNKKLNDYQMNTLGQRVVADIKDILTADSDYMKDLKRLYDSRDKAELLKFTRNRTQKLLPDVVKKAYRQLFSSPTKVKTTKTPPATTTSVVTAPVKGWQKIEASKAPAPDKIDNKKTTFNMKFRKQAILTDGSKVYWGSHVPESAA